MTQNNFFDNGGNFYSDNAVNLPTEEEYFSKRDYVIEEKQIPAYTCPICGGVVYKDVSMILTSNPPCYFFKCGTCDYSRYGR